MSFLPDAYQRNRKPLLEGRGLKVFRLGESRQSKKFNEFLIREGWGPEDILQDMMEDKSVRRLVKDIKKLLKDGVKLSKIAKKIEYLEAKASTRLTVEERTVLLQWLEKKYSAPKHQMPYGLDDLAANFANLRVTEGYSEKQIETLRKEYSHVKAVDPDSPTYKKLIKHLDSLPKDLLKHLADSNIKFVSALARNRIK